MAQQQRIISGDSGRRSIKIINENMEKIEIEARHGLVNFSKSKRSPFAMFNAKNDIIAAVDGGAANVYGKFTEIMLAPEQILHVTTDEIYLEYARNYVLNGLGRAVEDGEDVVFAGNLTTNNFKFVDGFVSSILGKHRVEYYNPKGEVIATKNFNITNAVIIPQGQSSLMDCAIRDDLSYDEKYFRQGIVVDLGRRTVCVLLVNKLNILKDKSFDHMDGVGMETLYHLIREELQENHGIRLSNYDIERIIMNNETLKDKAGTVMDFASIKMRAVAETSERIKNAVVEHFGEYHPDFVILTGGGVHLMGKLLQAIFPNSEILADPVWSNARGLEKLSLKGLRKKPA